MKKFGQPRAKYGISKVQYGYTANDGYDFFMCYGGQPNGKRVARLLMQALQQKYYNRFTNSYEPSLIEQLEVAGYDTRTLKISVEINKEINNESNR